MPVPILPDFIFIIIRVVVKRAVLIKLIERVSRLAHLLECVRELIIGWVSLTVDTPSTRSPTNLWWKSTFIRSFHSSVSFLREHSPNAERFTFPLCFTFEPKRRWLVWAVHSFIWRVRWAGSGGLTQCELKWPSFGCLIFKCEWVDGCNFIPFHCWLMIDLADK